MFSPYSFTDRLKPFEVLRYPLLPFLLVALWSSTRWHFCPLKASGVRQVHGAHQARMGANWFPADTRCRYGFCPLKTKKSQVSPQTEEPSPAGARACYHSFPILYTTLVFGTVKTSLLSPLSNFQLSTYCPHLRLSTSFSTLKSYIKVLAKNCSTVYWCYLTNQHLLKPSGQRQGIKYNIFCFLCAWGQKDGPMKYTKLLLCRSKGIFTGNSNITCWTKAWPTDSADEHFNTGLGPRTFYSIHMSSPTVITHVSLAICKICLEGRAKKAVRCADTEHRLQLSGVWEEHMHRH